MAFLNVTNWPWAYLAQPRPSFCDEKNVIDGCHVESNMAQDVDDFDDMNSYMIDDMAANMESDVANF